MSFSNPLDETIAAIATPMGIGAVGIIRIAGPAVSDVISTVCPSVSRFIPRMMHHTHIIDPESGKTLDDGCVVFFEGPKSYTGDDIAEFHLHGNPVVLKSVLDLILRFEVRLATKGEFTKRAFLNGKLDLTKAESVADLIHANSQKSQAVALNHLKGRLFTTITTIRQQLMQILEQVEGAIDFPDEVPPLNTEEMVNIVNPMMATLKKMIELGDFGEMVSTGVKVVIVGQPNVGKSSLLNQLAGQERAIVTPIAGTTRDFIEAKVELNGMQFDFIDTAGIRESGDYIEVLGMKKIKQLISRAHAVLWVLDGSRELEAADDSIYNQIKRKKRCLYGVINKMDRRAHLNIQSIKGLKGRPIVEISAKTGKGIDDLKTRLIQDFVSRYEGVELDWICNARQLQCIQSTFDSLVSLKESIDSGIGDDLLSIDLRNAILRLGELTGDEVTEQMLDGVFSRFCVGK